MFFYVLCMYCWNILLLLSYLILWRPSWNKCLLWFVWAHISAHCCEIALKVNTSEVHLAWLCQMTTMRRTHNKYVMWIVLLKQSQNLWRPRRVHLRRRCRRWRLWRRWLADVAHWNAVVSCSSCLIIINSSCTATTPTSSPPRRSDPTNSSRSLSLTVFFFLLLTCASLDLVLCPEFGFFCMADYGTVTCKGLHYSVSVCPLSSMCC